MPLLLKAAPIVESELEALRQESSRIKEAYDASPYLKIFLVGNDPASIIYTNSKKRFCKKFGAECEIEKLEESISECEFIDRVKAASSDDKINGMLIQLPLPSHLSKINLETLINPVKDVDGFHSKNLIHLIKNTVTSNSLVPCTPKGIMHLLDYYKIDIAGKNVVVLGRSLIVGRPLSLLLTNANATVTVCHSKSQNIQSITRRADVIFTAVGNPKFLGKDFIGDNKPFIIDVGVNHDENKKVCGDVNVKEIEDLLSGYTPVPGGVGPLTILNLAKNLIIATKNQCEQK